MIDWRMVGPIPSSIRKSFVSSDVKDASSKRIRAILERGVHCGDWVPCNAKKGAAAIILCLLS